MWKHEEFALVDVSLCMRTLNVQIQVFDCWLMLLIGRSTLLDIHFHNFGQWWRTFVHFFSFNQSYLYLSVTLDGMISPLRPIFISVIEHQINTCSDAHANCHSGVIYLFVLALTAIHWFTFARYHLHYHHLISIQFTDRYKFAIIFFSDLLKIK